MIGQAACGREWLADIIGGIGARDFPERLAASLHLAFGADHLCLFALQDGAGASAIATLGRIGARAAERLAGDYTRGGWFREDPNLSAIRAAGPVPRPLSCGPAVRGYSGAYRARFFASCGIVDKVAFAVRAPDGARLYFNIHRLADSGPFPSLLRASLVAASGVLAASILRDRAIRAAVPADACLDGLTRREAQVCRGILAGLSTEAIALDLGVSRNTVLTLRRRAYARLGVSSQAELFRRAYRLG
jgi:DNA-binding CsgD family transcriptional regulator